MLNTSRTEKINTTHTAETQTFRARLETRGIETSSPHQLKQSAAPAPVRGQEALANARERGYGARVWGFERRLDYVAAHDDDRTDVSAENEDLRLLQTRAQFANLTTETCFNLEDVRTVVGGKSAHSWFIDFLCQILRGSVRVA